jgi:simple sugar transport system ATP-binding protein
VTAPALELRAVEKRFGPVHALHGADFTLMPGELHALLGENGAGKSTLMHVAYGLVRPDAGEIRLHGVPAAVRSPRDSRRLGIGMVHQHFTSVPALSVAENVALAGGWPIRPRELRARTAALMQRVGLPLDPDAEAGSLAVALKQRLEILKALAADTTILLLDEPTGVLTPPEIDELLRVMRAFTASGGSAVLITHKLDEALRAADRVTVLRAGRVTLTGPARAETARSLAVAMLGTDASTPARSPSTRRPGTGPVLVRAAGLTVARERGDAIAVRDAALTLQGGDIVGIAAVEGNGQRELLRAIAGLAPVASGQLEVASPIAFIPEDRTTEGLIPELALTENLVLGLARGAPWVRGIRLDWRAARRRTAELMDAFSIRAPGPDAPAGTLSGGNQQRLIVARALEQRPRVLVAENPTRGLDIQAAAAVWERLRSAAAAGAAVLVYSSDLDEVLEQADRHLVMASGELHPVPEGSTREAIGALMLRARGRARLATDQAQP